jgi:hypothetical protein
MLAISFVYMMDLSFVQDPMARNIGDYDKLMLHKGPEVFRCVYV